MFTAKTSAATWGCYDCDYGTATSSATINVDYDLGYGTFTQPTAISIKYKNTTNWWPYEDEVKSTWIKCDYDTTSIKWKHSTCQTYGDWKYTSARWAPVVPSPEDRLKEIIQKRQAPAFIGSRTHLQNPTDIREVRARETLQRVLGDQKFRSFLKNGFVSVRGKSGLTYQIFPGHGMTNVYRDGVAVEKLCVVLQGQFPPTDSLIMRYLLILNDEQDFRKHAIKHSVHSRSRTQILIDERPLTEIFREMKVA